MKYRVRLENDTVGTVDDDTLDGQHPDSFIGEELNVHLYDENGNPIEESGIMAETLEENV